MIGKALQDSPPFACLFDPEDELVRLRGEVAVSRKSMLVFGEEGAGKTRLLKRFADTAKFALYVSDCNSPTGIIVGLLDAMQKADVSKELLKTSSSGIRNLTGVVQRVLDQDEWILVLDHVRSPSVALGRLVKELNYYNRTPVVFAGRSEHMEDIGTFRTFCTNRSSRLELKPWTRMVALEFAKQQAARVGLEASNLDEALQGIAEMSKGYPGPILKMLRMAKEPAYQRDGQIKFHVVGLDYRLRGTRAQ